MTPDFLPLSYINQYDYCPRRFWYIYVQGQMVENAHVLRGIINHERAHTPGEERLPDDGKVMRAVHIHSHTLGINGVCDLVEVQADGRFYPVEYKQGQQGKWDNDRAQLCAQALCLEEMTGQTIEHGALFYFGSRRRIEVQFTADLRQYTRHLIQAIQHALALDEIPPHTHQRQRCNGCSLIDICLPKETLLLQSLVISHKS